MFKLAVVEIAGRQYMVTPGMEFNVNSLGDVKALDCDKVLLVIDGTKISIGTPYLKEKISFEVLRSQRSRKIRVAKFHAKANWRKVYGARQLSSKLKTAGPKVETKVVKEVKIAKKVVKKEDK